MKKYILITLSLSFLFGCTGGEETKTVTYYIKHQEEMTEKLKYCKESFDREKETNCQNAISARAKISTAKLFGRDPLKN